MRLFRDEEHVGRWCAARGLPVGDVFPPERLWRLAVAWYADRLSPTWHRRPAAEVNALFAELGFAGDFWRV